MNNNRRIPANEFFSNILEQKNPGVAVPNEQIVNFENGQLTEVREDVTTPTVKISEVAPVEQSEQGEPVVATEVGAEIPTEIQQVDQKIATAVESEIQSEGGDVQQIEAVEAPKTEMPLGNDVLLKRHDVFVKSSGEAGTSEAAEIEEVWDPFEEK